MVLTSSDLNRTRPDLERRLEELYGDDRKQLLADTAVEALMRRLEAANADDVTGDYSISFSNGSLAGESLQIKVSTREQRTSGGTITWVILSCTKYGVYKEFPKTGEEYDYSKPLRANSPSGLQKLRDFFNMKFLDQAAEGNDN